MIATTPDDLSRRITAALGLERCHSMTLKMEVNCLTTIVAEQFATVEQTGRLVDVLETNEYVVVRRSGVTEPLPKEKRAEVPDGSEPVAFAVVSDSTEQIDCEFVYPDEATAGDVALESNGGVVALYRQPQPTITDAERHALRDAAESFEYDDDDADCARVAATLRGLLERAGGGE